MSLTTGQIATRVQDNRSRVRHAILKLGLKPIGYAGRYNLYAEEDLPAIKAALGTMRRMVLPATAETR